MTHLMTSDGEAVRAASARFSDAVNRRDSQQFRALWTEDAVWTVPGLIEAVGRDDIADTFRRLLEPWEVFFQLPGTAVVEVSGETATARTPLREVGRSADGAGYTAHGINVDELVR